jgi:hypothetical protein
MIVDLCTKFLVYFNNYSDNNICLYQIIILIQELLRLDQNLLVAYII